MKAPAGSFIWADGKTLDILLPIDASGHPFSQDIEKFACPVCGKKLDDPEAITKDFTDTTSGVFLECSGCAQKIFFHKRLIVLK